MPPPRRAAEKEGATRAVKKGGAIRAVKKGGKATKRDSRALIDHLLMPEERPEEAQDRTLTETSTAK